MSKIDHYDNVLLGILQNEGQITNFLDVFFSFLFRKTDLFRHMLHPKDNYGFMPGVPKKLVLAAFKKYELMAAGRNERLKQEYEERKKREIEEMKEAVSMEVEVTTTQQPQQQIQPQQIQQNTDNSTSATTTRIQGTSSTIETSITAATSTFLTTTTPTTTPTTTIPTTPKTTTTTSTIATPNIATTTPTITTPTNGDSKTDNMNTTREDDSLLEQQQKEYQADPLSYNGAVRNTYKWSQSITDLDVYVKMPSHIKKGKQVEVLVTKDHMRVGHYDVGGVEKVVLVDDVLCWPVQAHEVTWSLEPGVHVHISMEKKQERWWDGLLTREDKINIRKIDNSRPITDLDHEAQAKVEEMLHNERQKKMGLPQSHEVKMHEMLEKAWDVEGSPFQGQPFDPSKINFNQSPNI